MKVQVLSQVFPSDDQRHEVAAEWLMILSVDPGMAQDPLFRDWLEDPQNARAYQGAQRAWDLAGVVGPEMVREAARPAPHPARRRWHWPRLLPAGLALASLVLAGLWLDRVRPDLRMAWAADHANGTTTPQDLRLTDGSQGALDAGSALDFADLVDARRVTMRTGAAWFEVARDGRPFTVSLHGVEVRALGTRFSVRDCGATCVEVTLEEGVVEVAVPGAGRVALQPGQQFRHDALGPARVASVDLPAALAWREGRYTFINTTLGEVADVLARHGAGAVVFAHPSLADHRISGTIDLQAAETELRALGEAVGFRLIPVPGGHLLM